MGIVRKQDGHGHTLLWAAVGLLNIQRETAALKIEPPFHGRIEMCLLYDGFFSFAVVRQISIDTFLKVPLLLLVTLFLLQLLYRHIL